MSKDLFGEFEGIFEDNKEDVKEKRKEMTKVAKELIGNEELKMGEKSLEKDMSLEGIDFNEDTVRSALLGIEYVWTILDRKGESLKKTTEGDIALAKATLIRIIDKFKNNN